MIYGYNVLKVNDKGAFLAHLRKLNPPAVLFYNDENDFARQVKAEFPQMTVIYRHWPDAELHKDIPGRKKITPAEWIAAHEAQAAGGLYLYTMNESGLDQAVIDWHMQVMDLAIAKGIHLVLLNPATGTWDTPDYERLKPLLIKASQHKDLFIIGLHSYAGGVITSGIAGGNPDHAGVDPNGLDKDKGRNLIPRENWPSRDDIARNHMTTFHIGRHSWIIDYCNSIGLSGDKMPRFALTETGFDYLGDIGTWLNKLNLPPGYGSVNGWRSLNRQWGMWWRDFNDASQAFVEQFKWAETVLMPGLEFALFFAYGDDGNWTNYDISLSDIPALLEKAVDVPIVKTKPMPMPKPLNASNPHRQTLVSMGSGRIVRAGAGVDFEAYKTLKNGDVITMYDPVKTDGQNMRWVWIESTIVNGWLCIDGVQFAPPPPVVSIDPVATNPPQPSTTIPEPPIADDDTQKPPIHDFTIHVRVKTADPTAARLTAVWATQLLQNRWKDLDDMKELFRLLDSIDDVQFDMT